jgi:hypothetical protein
MPNTYTLISSNVLSSSAASVTFSSIPSTYTDLVLRMSARGTWGGATGIYTEFNFNGDTSSIHSWTMLTGYGSGGVVSARYTAQNFIAPNVFNGAGSTSNTFTNIEMYVPNYAGNKNKVASIFGVDENNNTAAEIGAVAGLYSSTSAITSISIRPDSGAGNFVSGSSFYLYGIKNS